MLWLGDYTPSELEIEFGLSFASVATTLVIAFTAPKFAISQSEAVSTVLIFCEIKSLI